MGADRRTGRVVKTKHAVHHNKKAISYEQIMTLLVKQKQNQVAKAVLGKLVLAGDVNKTPSFKLTFSEHDRTDSLGIAPVAALASIGLCWGLFAQGIFKEDDSVAIFAKDFRPSLPPENRQK